MIRKPAADAYRPDRTVEAARRFGDVASESLSAARSGIRRAYALFRAVLGAIAALAAGVGGVAYALQTGNIARSIWPLGLSLFFGWIAWRNARIAFAGARTSGAESRPAPSGFSPGPWQYPDGTAGPIGTNARGGVSAIYYSRTKLLLRAAILFPACFLIAFALKWHFHWNVPDTTLALVAAGLALAGSIRLVLMGVNSDLRAISWDDRQIRVRTLGSSRQVPWEALEAVQTRQLVQRLLGVITVSRRTTGLVFRMRDRGSRRTMIVPTFALSVGHDAALAMIQNAALRRLRTTGYDARDAERPLSGRQTAAGQHEPEPKRALDAVEGTRGFGGRDRAMSARPAFGKKLV